MAILISCNELSSFFILWLFLLFLNRVIKHVIAIFILCSFGLNQKNQKFKPGPKLRRPGRPTHKKSLKVCKKHFTIELIVRTCCSVLFETHKGAVFFVYNLQRSQRTIEHEKEGAGTSLILIYDRNNFIE